MTNSHQTGAAQEKSLADMNLADFLDASPVATFIINSDHVVTHFNKACAMTLGISADQVIGRKGLGHVFYGHDRPVMADLIVDGSMKKIIDDLYQNKYRGSLVVPDAYEAEGFFPNLGTTGRWLFFTAAPLRSSDGKIAGAIETLQDITERKVAESALMTSQLEIEQVVEQRTAQLAEVNETLREDVNRREIAERALLERNTELNALNATLVATQDHLVQSEKLASIGQLAAGVAHEINNPVGFVNSNLGSLQRYVNDMLRLLSVYEQAEEAMPGAAVQEIRQVKEEIDVQFLREDVASLLSESLDGLKRVTRIVQDLKDFSHVDANPDWQFSNLNQCIDSTLNVVNNEVKYKADLIKDYDDLPEVQCMPSQISQVVMNLMVNAAHAMGTERGRITVRTGVEGDKVWFEVADTGSGIPKDVLPRIFDPFYTTKPVGKGTGLGLSLSHGIVQKHHGNVNVQTAVGQGTTIRVTLPISQPATQAPDGACPP